MSPDSLEMITKKNSHFIQSYDNYRENLQEKTKAHNEKVSIVKRTKFESNRNQLEERRQDLRIKYDRKLLKLRKFEAMEVQRNWFSFFMFFSSILAVKYSINNYGIRKINSRKWFRLIWYASRFLGRLCIIIKRVRRRNKYKVISI